MLAEHLGVTQEVDPRVATFENIIIRSLRKHGPSYQKDVWVRTTGRRIGAVQFQAIVDCLVERGVIVRETTTRVNSFRLRMAPDKRRRERASARRVEIQEPLRPEAA